MSELDYMVGKVAVSVEQTYDRFTFAWDDGGRTTFLHWQDCCESVTIEDVVGDLSDLVGSPIILAEEVTKEVDPEDPWHLDPHVTWTFYRFATEKGLVTVRWYGESNGYYSESVNHEYIPPMEPL